MAAADAATIEAGTPGEVLMDRAGHAVARTAIRELGGRYGRRAAVVCGKGNNGGDGFVVARVLRDEGLDVRCLVVMSLNDVSGSARTHLERLLSTGALVEPFGSGSIADVDVVIDAVFGTGFAGVAEGGPGAAIDAMVDSPAVVIAVDIPSGVNGNTGAVDGPAVRADVTVALAAEKIGTAVGKGAELAGRVEVADIGLPVPDSQIHMTESADAAEILPQRQAAAHKRSTGTVAVLAGSDQFTGAPMLTCLGALRMGSGYVTLGTTEAVRSAATTELPELVIDVITSAGELGPDALESFKIALERADVVVVGPGIGNGDPQKALLERIIAEVELPTVVDADGLNVIARDTSILRSRRNDLVLTPHPAELARLLASSVDAVQGDRVAAVKDAAGRFGCTVLLKGYRSLIADRRGSVVVNPTGGSELATAGTGDVLAGAIGALVGAGNGAFEAAWAGAYVHGIAGSLASNAVGTDGVVASDVADRLGVAADVVRGSE